METEKDIDRSIIHFYNLLYDNDIASQWSHDKDFFLIKKEPFKLYNFIEGKRKEDELKKALLRYFLQQSKTHDKKTPIEIKKQEYIKQAKALHGEILLSLPTSPISVQMVNLLYDDMITILDANNEAVFDWVDIDLGLIRANLTNYSKSQDDQKKARRWATWTTIVSIIIIILISTIVATFDLGFDVSRAIPLIGIPWSVLLWSFIGSMTAILYRFNVQEDVELQDPFRWLFARPMTGVIMGIIVYLAIKVGLGAFDVQSVDFLNSEIIWIIAFIGGFSDKLSDTILRLLVGRFGGDSTGGPLASSKFLNRPTLVAPEAVRYPRDQKAPEPKERPESKIATKTQSEVLEDSASEEETLNGETTEVSPGNKTVKPRKSGTQ